MNIPHPELEQLLQLSRSGRNHRDRTTYLGLPAHDHQLVLAALSPDRAEAKRLHKGNVAAGFLSPPVATSRGGKGIRVQFIYEAKIVDVLKGGRDDE
jgi:hypothetical protein